MRLQVCGTSVKIPHISLAEMKKNVNMKTLLCPHEQRMRKLNSTSDKTSSLSPWNEMWDKRKDIKCKLQMEKKLTGRVLVVNNTSTHCSNNNVALNVSRLQLCGVSKKKKKKVNAALWWWPVRTPSHKPEHDEWNISEYVTSEVHLWSFFFQSDSDISQWWTLPTLPPLPSGRTWRFNLDQNFY